LRGSFTALHPQRHCGGVALVTDLIVYLGRGDVANELSEGYRIAGAF
jgi:hypothetical protein